MVGIVIASHGEFAKGILQSGEMIFGKQEKVAAVTFMPNEGPDDLRKHLDAAIASFASDDEVLFLIDLWGGSPFNQSNAIYEEHKDKMAIVTGLNLPMLIEAYSSRSNLNSAHEIAAHILVEARAGVRTKPEELTPKAAAPKAKAAIIPQGDGQAKISLARLDSRLLHGQVATAWSKSVNPTRIIVVSDNVAKDQLRKSLITEAAPPGIKANVIPIDKMIKIWHDPRFGNERFLLLFETAEDVARAVDGGVDIPELNIGSLAHSDGKTMINNVLAVDQKDVDTFEHLRDKGVKFDVRKVPSDDSKDMLALIKKAGFKLDDSKEKK
ncbi:PTS mannose transporter subunit IIAB [Oenococcus sicerae]|uniref:PTS system mannose-specific EIIAB component n=1 Tax=Oenococcus sicerae TaxID=2203724 RepID=A0AAJ1VMA9_9LACO|nr:mannose/fructose/sorbose PTS transporter subunit IIA [Oenococcus sicerae]MDN6900368.1 PTS mannose transporter subunit IIAB [Oenococcus sicerae]QAS69943.1 PTS mannose transporter subunit IIAB [Oenococcus sicerae]